MCYRRIVIALLICVLVDFTWAAKRVDANLRARETLRRRRDARLQQRDNTQLDVPELFQLTEGESLKNVRETNDAYGMTVERLQETYKGIKVYDTAVVVHKTSTGQLTGEATGTFVQDIAEDLPDIEAKISYEKALEIALQSEGDEHDDIVKVKHETEIFLDEDGRARLVIKLSYVIEGVKRPNYITDAQSGEVLKHWQGLNNYPCCERKYNATGGNEKGGKVIYGNMPYCLTPTIANGTCYLENEYVSVIDEDLNSYETAHFKCSEGYDDEINGAYSPATDVFFHGTVVGKMFEEWFASTPFDNRSVELRVHAGYDMENAYWNGDYCTFGDGYSTFFPLTSLDIVAHEIGHGVTEFNSDLEYSGESGGLNEAFSDIMGEAAEEYLLKSDFMTGQTVMKNDPYLREFERPENDNVSISHVDDMSSYTDVHYSSGIYRRIWYVVVKEEGVPVRDAFSVFLHANRMYWHETSSFYDASCGLLEAAVDLGCDTRPFRKAFRDVGIEYCTTVSDVPVLQNNETQFGITVSDKINPRFVMDTPDLADTFIATVKSNNSEEVLITVTTGGWNVTDGAQVVAEGVKSVKLQHAGGQSLLIRLSLSSNTSVDECGDQVGGTSTAVVDFTAGFTCRTGHNNYDYYEENSYDYNYNTTNDYNSTYDDHSYDGYGDTYGNDTYDYDYIGRQRRSKRSNNTIALC